MNGNEAQVRPAQSAAPYLIAVVSMCFLGVAGCVAVYILRPERDNTAIIVSILGFVAPTTAAILAFMKAQETHLSVNSRLDEMVRNASLAAHATGMEEGRTAGRIDADARTDKIAEKKA